MPSFDGSFWLLLASRVLHILGAAILVGGLIYVRFVTSPSAAGNESPPPDVFFGGRRSAWAKWIGIATALLLVTGAFNYWKVIELNEKMAGSYHMLLGIKILLGMVLFFLAAILAGRTQLAEQLRHSFRTWINICVLLSVVVVLLASTVRFYKHTPRSDASGAAGASRRRSGHRRRLKRRVRIERSADARHGQESQKTDRFAAQEAARPAAALGRRQTANG